MNKKISKIYNVTVQNSSIVDIEKNKATARTRYFVFLCCLGAVCMI